MDGNFFQCTWKQMSNRFLGLKDNLKLVLQVSGGGEGQQAYTCCGKGKGKHLARNWQNSESHLLSLATDRCQKDILLRAHRVSQLPLDPYEGK